MEIVLRRLIARLALGTVLGLSLVVHAQEAKQAPRVAYVWLYRIGPSAPFVEAFDQRLKDLGWVEVIR